VKTKNKKSNEKEDRKIKSEAGQYLRNLRIANN
jgi:hypothetical protein